MMRAGPDPAILILRTAVTLARVLRGAERVAVAVGSVVIAGWIMVGRRK